MATQQHPLVQSVKNTLSQVNWENLDAHISSNEHVAQFFFLNHAIIMANLTYSVLLSRSKEGKKPGFLIGLFVMFGWGFGGSILNALMQGAPCPLINDAYIGVFLCSWVLTYCTFGLWRFLTGNILVEFVTFALQGVYVAEFVFIGAEAGAKAFPGSHVGTILVSFLSTCGGSYLLPYLITVYNGELPTTTEISNPTLGTILPFVAALFSHVASNLKLMDKYSVTVQGIVIVVTPQLVVRILFVFLYLLYWAQNHFSFAAPRPTKRADTESHAPVVEKPVAGKSTPVAEKQTGKKSKK